MSNNQAKSMKLQSVWKDRLASFESTSPAFILQVAEAMGQDMSEEELKRLCGGNEILYKEVRQIVDSMNEDDDDEDENEAQDEEEEEEEIDEEEVKKQKLRQMQQVSYARPMNSKNQSSAQTLVGRSNSGPANKVSITTVNKGFEKDSR
jgi:hypothetical protein